MYKVAHRNIFINRKQYRVGLNLYSHTNMDVMKGSMLHTYPPKLINTETMVTFFWITINMIQ